MAGYTQLNDSALRQHLRPFELGELIEAHGVDAGGIHTVYDISTTRGRFLLRILEDRSTTDAHFEEALLQHLEQRGLRVPSMVDAGNHGFVVPIAPRQQLSVFRYLPGRVVGVFEVRAEHTRQVGEFLASMHLATRGFRRQRKNRFEPQRLAATLERCVTAVSNSSQVRDLKVLALELVRHRFPSELPRGIVHGDLTIEKAHFTHGKLSCVLDFKTASCGPLVYDLAVALCDWAFLHDELVPERARSLVAGYQSKRPLTPLERASLHELCRYAATRYAATRFYEFEARKQERPHRLYKDYRHLIARLESLRALGLQAFHDLVFGRHAHPAGTP